VKKQIRILGWVAAGSVALLLALVLAIEVAAPRLLNLESVKSKIQAEFSRVVGGDLDFERLDLSLLPQPSVAIHQARVNIPKIGQWTLSSLKIRPAILPLFKGSLRIAKIRVEAPDFELQFPPIPGPAKKGEAESRIFESLEKGGASLFELLASKAPNLVVVMRQGRIRFVENGQTAVVLQDIDAEVVFPPKGPRVEVTCGSNLWKNLSVEGSLDPGRLSGKGRIELSGFLPQAVADLLFPDARFGLSESVVYLRADVRTDRLRRFQGEVTASVPLLTLRRDKEEVALTRGNMEAAFSIDDEETSVSVSRLSLDHPRLRLRGKFLMDKKTPEVRLDLEARELDLDSARKVALCLGRDTPVVERIFEYVRGGTLPFITFHSHGIAFRELGAANNLSIEARIREGRVYVPGPALAVEEVEADVVVSTGVLEVKNGQGRLGNSRGRDVTLRVGLKGKDAPFHADIGVQADLAEIPELLKRLVHSGVLNEEVSRVANVRGSATGRLVLGESLQSIRAKVDLSEIKLTGRQARIPHDVRIDAGTFSYAPDRIGGENLSGRIGKSAFQGISYQLALGAEPRLAVRGGTVTLCMDEVYPWLVSYEVVRRELDALQDVKGEVELTELRLEGPLTRPADWDFETRGICKNLNVNATLCPGPLALASGRFRADPKSLSFTNVKCRILDASVDASGALEGYFRGLDKAEVALNGTSGPQAIQWVSDTANLPTEFKVRSPVSFADTKLFWNKDKEMHLRGVSFFPGRLKVSIDLMKKNETFLLNRLSFQDETSRATLSFAPKKDAYALKFTGNLEHGTLEKVFVNSVAPTLHVQGDFMIDLRLDDPSYSKAQGYLEAKDFSIPYGWMAPIRVDSLSLLASEKGLRVHPAHLTLEETDIAIEGDLNFSEGGLLVDMDLTSERIEWATVERVIDRAKAADQQEISSRLAVEGTVRCRSEAFKYGQFTWQPLLASVTFSRDALRVAVTEGVLCGISTLGALNINGESTSVDFRLLSKDQNLAATLPCLSQSEREVTGTFNLTGEVKGQGSGDTLIQSLRGNLKFSARQGHIYRSRVLSKIFSLLNVTEVFRGKKVDLRSDDLAYDSMNIQADLENGKLDVKEFALEGPTMGIAGQGSLDLVGKKADATLLLAPLRTVDFIIEKTPVVSTITGGKLVTVPVKVTGDWGDPGVSLLSAASVGNRLLGIMKNTLLLPVMIAEPVIPKAQQQDSP
jgi:AsmA-like C-terminal region/AsmA family